MFVEEKVGDFDTIAFAKMLGWKKEEVSARFKEIKDGEGSYYNKSTKKRTSNYLKSRAYPFLKELTLDEILKIAPFLDKFPGFYEEATSMRSYPFANGANILGYLSEVTGEEIKKDRFYKPANNIGRTGIEKFYEKHKFRSFEDLQKKIRIWNEYYNNLEHCSLNGKTPNEMVGLQVTNVCA
jgi:penicillin-binding protein 2